MPHGAEILAQIALEMHHEVANTGSAIMTEGAVFMLFLRCFHAVFMLFLFCFMLFLCCFHAVLMLFSCCFYVIFMLKMMDLIGEYGAQMFLIGDGEVEIYRNFDPGKRILHLKTMKSVSTMMNFVLRFANSAACGGRDATETEVPAESPAS